MVKTLLSNVGTVGSIHGRGVKIPCALGPKNQNIKLRQFCNKFNKDLKVAHIKKIIKKKKVIKETRATPFFQWFQKFSLHFISLDWVFPFLSHSDQSNIVTISQEPEVKMSALS